MYKFVGAQGKLMTYNHMYEIDGAQGRDMTNSHTYSVKCGLWWDYHTQSYLQRRWSVGWMRSSVAGAQSVGSGWGYHRSYHSREGDNYVCHG